MIRIAIVAIVAVFVGMLVILQVGTPGSNGSPSSSTLMLQLLHSIPNVEGARTLVAINLYEKADDALNIERSWGSGNAAIGELSDYIFSLRTKGALQDGPFISGFDPDYSIALSVMARNAGYDIRDIRASIRAGLDVNRYEAVSLSQDAAISERAIRQSEAWPAPHKETYQGVDILGWGEDFQVVPGQRLNPPAFDQTGRGMKLAFSKNIIFGTFSLQMTKEMIDASTSDEGSLGSDPVFQALARGASSLNLYSVIFSSRTQSMENILAYLQRITLNEEQFEQLKSDLAKEPMLKPYTAMGTGIGVDEDGQFYMGLILVHENEAVAEQNLALTGVRLSGLGVTSWKKPWDELLNTSNASYELVGNTLLIKLPMAENRASNIWVDWFYLQDPLLLHE